MDNFLAIVGAIIIVALLLFFFPLYERDDTDPPNGRSGMLLYTDALTGCQYLSQRRIGLTPRVDGKGKHVGCKE